jgi:hypothetical protein
MCELASTPFGLRMWWLAEVHRFRWDNTDTANQVLKPSFWALSVERC